MTCASTSSSSSSGWGSLTSRPRRPGCQRRPDPGDQRRHVDNDGLIIASGGRFIKKLPGIEHAITPCEGIAAAQAIRDRVRAMDGGTIAMGFAGNPNEPSSMRGGPVFEFLFGMDTQLRREGRRERFKLVFFTPADKPGNRLGPKAVGSLLKEMARLGIETHLGAKLKGFSERQVTTEAGSFDADLIIFMPGMTGERLVRQHRTAALPGRAAPGRRPVPGAGFPAGLCGR